MTERLAGVVLAAGEGRRLRPLTSLRPKPMCPVQGRPLLDLALDRVAHLTGPGPANLAVNAHHLAEQIVAHVAGTAHVTVEPRLLGTAGALGALAPWIDGRDVLLTNADAYLDPADCLGPLARGPRDRVRLLVARPGRGQRADFVDPEGNPAGWRYVGGCYLPGPVAAALPDEPSGLYEVLWRDLASRGELDFVELAGTAVDCGTPADYLRANLAGGARNVVAPRAVVEGSIDRCVVWDGAHVAAEEVLHDCIRAGDAAHPVTVPA